MTQKLNKFLKILFIIFVFLLPFHALIITTLKCKFEIDTNIIRFWKEGLVIILLFITFIDLYLKKKNISNLLKGNYLVGVTITFIITSLIFIGFPYFEFKVSNFLGFKYDVFFLFCMLLGIYLNFIKENLKTLLYTIFISGFTSIAIFFPWYLFGDISKLSDVFGYSNKVSTYKANTCISFSQNVEGGHHRFQGTFGSPINMSIFFVVFYLIYVGFILNKKFDNNYVKVGFIAIPTLFIIPSIFYSYSKTSILGLAFAGSIFTYLTAKFIFNKSLKKSQLYFVYGILLISFISIVIIKRDLFLHLDAVLNRLENLIRSLEMFRYNPIGYGLGVAGPASQIGRSIESLGNWQIIAQSTSHTALFLPENWYIQILLEQGIIGFSIFISLFLIIGFKLFEIIKKKKDFLSIGIFSAFIGICFMALFCHAFEDAGIVYPLFMIIGSYITINLKLND